MYIQRSPDPLDGSRFNSNSAKLETAELLAIQSLTIAAMSELALGVGRESITALIDRCEKFKPGLGQKIAITEEVVDLLCLVQEEVFEPNNRWLSLKRGEATFQKSRFDVVSGNLDPVSPTQVRHFNRVALYVHYVIEADGAGNTPNFCMGNHGSVLTQSISSECEIALKNLEGAQNISPIVKEWFQRFKGNDGARRCAQKITVPFVTEVEFQRTQDNVYAATLHGQTGRLKWQDSIETVKAVLKPSSGFSKLAFKSGSDRAHFMASKILIYKARLFSAIKLIRAAIRAGDRELARDLVTDFLADEIAAHSDPRPGKTSIIPALVDREFNTENKIAAIATNTSINRFNKLITLFEEIYADDFISESEQLLRLRKSGR